MSQRKLRTFSDLENEDMIAPYDDDTQGGGGTLQLKIWGGWLDSLGSESLVGKDILGFFKNIALDNS